jgi:hypothetical protein
VRVASISSVLSNIRHYNLKFTAPALGPALITDEIQDAICNDCGIQQEATKVSLDARLAEIAEKINASFIRI